MPFKLRTPGGDRTWFAAGLMIVGPASSIKNLVYNHAGLQFTLLGLVFFILGVGLWFNKQWARWATTLLVVTLSGYVAVRMVTHGVTLLRALYVPGMLCGAWFIWKDFAPSKIAADNAEKRPIISLVLLLREPRYLEAKVLAQIVSAAWGGDYSSADGEDKDSCFVVGESPMFIIQSPEAPFMVHNVARPYFDNLEALVEEITEMRLRKAVEAHRAWLSVDLIRPFDKDRSSETFYPQIAKLIAELAGPDCLAIVQPQTQRINVWDASLEKKLRGPNAMEEFAMPVYVPVTEVAGDDPRMEAAVAEARSRWPEFVEAFKKRDGEGFSIKAPITVEETTEYIWIEVNGLEPEYIHGTLGNDPVNLGEMKIGDRVEVPVKDMTDWVFVRNGGPVGLFTLKVLEQAKRERK